MNTKKMMSSIIAPFFFSFTHPNSFQTDIQSPCGTHYVILYINYSDFFVLINTQNSEI